MVGNSKGAGLMALVLRGKDKGKKVVLHQWCNDWFTIKNSTKVYSPSSLRLSNDEVDKFLRTDSGIMLNLYTLTTDGTFKRRK